MFGDIKNLRQDSGDFWCRPVLGAWQNRHQRAAPSKRRVKLPSGAKLSKVPLPLPLPLPLKIIIPPAPAKLAPMLKWLSLINPKP
jgi:hypothetical protein